MAKGRRPARRPRKAAAAASQPGPPRQAPRAYTAQEARRLFDKIGEYAATRNPMGYTEADVPRLLREIRAAEPPPRSISECIALAKKHEDDTGEAPILDHDFAADVEEIVRNRGRRSTTR